ncbi:hypothetical protein AWC38_SpisGene11242 [Stylophora pistillata]|uniref:Uncharacterized protein n=1 Tax=Stylophora pistillata TaxID=50429 RepID=A0A2B4S6T2_STYPI|nr:hypothetical protein AWC38_SpisGene11242 [Stylophora pistillata]
MQGKSKGSVSAIKNEDGIITINVKDKAESFNDFFSKVGERLANDILTDTSANEHQHVYQTTPTIEPVQFNVHKTKRVIDKRVKPGKECGPYNITSRGLKLEGDAVAVGLSYVMEHAAKVPFVRFVLENSI